MRYCDTGANSGAACIFAYDDGFKYDVPVNDLHKVIANVNPDTCLRKDGVHMNEKGNKLLADAVAGAIKWASRKAE